jgi:hypothetical protein
MSYPTQLARCADFARIVTTLAPVRHSPLPAKTIRHMAASLAVRSSAKAGFPAYDQGHLKKMIRQEFLADLRPILRRSAAWRAKQSKRFPDDRRNQVAATTLEMLAQATPVDLSPEIWADLASFFEPGGNYQSPAWDRAIAETARLIGFRTYPEDLNEFLDGFLAKLTAERVNA